MSKHVTISFSSTVASRKVKMSPGVDFKTDLTFWETSDHWQFLLTSPRAADPQCLQRTFIEMFDYRLKIWIWKFSLPPQGYEKSCTKAKITMSLFCYLFFREQHASNASVWSKLQIFCLLLQCFKLLQAICTETIQSVHKGLCCTVQTFRCGEVFTWWPTQSLSIFPAKGKILTEVGNYPYAELPRMKVAW